ncbi:hypothetical protein [Hymenobacter elongatus]|uniref:Outer membrane protein assembly factor BamE n=1 Tax=Hymenobacter elongatus TaxID=877208 RepID=A0A4Z0PI26_9BACT|nr:hypothetical protein [Hymenobacter elongatus]TGE14480.1 hypothetical protein E5J99_16115 [Hymenobacter elongatus]
MAIRPRWFAVTLSVLLGLFMLLAIGAASVYFIFFSGAEARLGKANALNSYKVKKGMSKQRALHIMGPPKKTETRLTDSSTVYLYTTAPLASHEIAIVVGQDSLVAAVYHGY